MRVMVTGGAGYIGSHVSRRLRDRGYDVLKYDNLCTGHQLLMDGFETVVADLRSSEQLRKALKQVSAVIHVAGSAYVGESVQQPMKYFDNNVSQGLNLLDLVIESRIRYLVFSSSCAVYGIPQSTPITEACPRQPVNPYGISKLFFEHAMESYAEAYGLRSVSLRYFNAAGADESAEIGEIHDPETHLIPLMLQVAGGRRAQLEVFGDDYPTRDGTCLRDYVHVNDLAEAHVLALNYLRSGGKSIALNLGTGEGRSVLEVVHCVESTLGRRIPAVRMPRRDGDPAELVASAELAQSVLGWKPKRSFDEIIGTAWKWNQRHNGILDRNQNQPNTAGD